MYATDLITVFTFMKEGSLSDFNSLRNRNLETQLISYRAVRLTEALDSLGVIKIIFTSNGNDTCLWVFLNSRWQQTT